MNYQDQNQTQEPSEKPLTQEETAEAIAHAASSSADAATAVGDTLKSVHDAAANGTITNDIPPGADDETHTATHSPDAQPGSMLTSVAPAEHEGQAQEAGPANLAAAQASEETPQQMFDLLVARKKALWVQISHLDYEKRSLTATQKEIDDIDKKMLAIWKTYPGQITREEDK